MQLLTPAQRKKPAKNAEDWAPKSADLNIPDSRLLGRPKISYRPDSVADKFGNPSTIHSLRGSSTYWITVVSKRVNAEQSACPDKQQVLRA